MSQNKGYFSDVLSDLLAVYYNRLFPFDHFYRWLNYGGLKVNYFQHREFSITLEDDIYIRFLSFPDQKALEDEIKKRIPHKIDIGAVYNFRPKDHRMVQVFNPEERELVFDIDMTDYDDVRVCCSGADICNKCWRFMSVACTVLDKALREDFGFEHLLWVFSGRRGVHCWVCDESARKLDSSARAAVAEYLQIVSGGENQAKKTSFIGSTLHPSVKRANRLIEKDFVDTFVEEQDILGTPHRLSKVLSLVSDTNLRAELERELKKYSTSRERWEAFVSTIRMFRNKGQLKRNQFIIEETMLQYVYPRLDINVTKGLNHLLKAPFCVHPKTGKVCMPFKPGAADKFDPSAVPTISKLIDEVNEFDKALKKDELGRSGIKDYKKTAMNKGIAIFEEFLRKLENSWKGKKIEISDAKMEF